MRSNTTLDRSVMMKVKVETRDGSVCESFLRSLDPYSLISVHFTFYGVLWVSINANELFV